MKFAETLTEAERVTLEELFKNHKNHRSRIRAHAILLSRKGYSLDQISRIYDIHRDRASKWIDNWETEGITGLFDDERSGRPPKLTEAERKKVVEYVQEEPKSIKHAIAKVEKEHKKIVSGQTIKRILKRLK